MVTIGLDLGSSFIKGELYDVASGKVLDSAQYPDKEFEMHAKKTGWAEQNPEKWWEGIKIILQQFGQSKYSSSISAIGISYQMHGLVAVDNNLNPVRNSIIWCDSRAVEYGKKAFNELGREFCLSKLLNSPGNFTASKLKWVKENEPAVYNKIHKVMLPGDFIAAKLTGEITTTVSGLSEGILYDFEQNSISSSLLDYYELDKELIPSYHGSFEGELTILKSISDSLGLPETVKVTYRSGDQPNNAFSLNVLDPGEIAATAGTSGVVYGISDLLTYDPKSRVNTFAHVNYAENKTRLGILLCINGTGILNRWVKDNFKWNSYEAINQAAAEIPEGSDGLMTIPFGNGAERVLEDITPGCSFHSIDFNRHNKNHIARAAQEGIAFSLFYGIQIMRDMGLELSTVKAGHANMFLSPVFSATFANLSQVPLNLYNTNGAIGAAIGSAMGLNKNMSRTEAFSGLSIVKTIEPNPKSNILEYFNHWESTLIKQL